MIFTPDSTIHPSPPWWQSIGRRFILHIILFSSVITLGSTAIQLYYEYRRDLQHIDENIEQIEHSYLKSLAEGLWSFNQRILEIQLQGILDLPDLRYLEIRRDGAPFIKVGTPVAGRTITREFPLTYRHRDQELKLGTLYVVAGMDGVYRRLIDRVVLILLTQAVKTSFVSAFIFTLFHFMVGRHLATMADFARKLNIDRLDKPLVIPRSTRYADSDEIGQIVSAMNEMQQRLHAGIKASRDADQVFQMLAQNTARLIGQDLFDTIVRDICTLLHCNCAIIGELTDPGTVRTLAMVNDGAVITDYAYSLAGTPCDDVIAKGYCIYPKGVTTFFPTDQELVAMKAEGYVGIPIRDQHGEPLGILCAISKDPIEAPPRLPDILEILQTRAGTEIERRRAEKEKSRLAEHMRQSQKLEAIGTLAGGIAHDFNNILTPILGYADMMQAELPDGELREDMKRLVLATKRARDLVKQILTFSRQAQNERIPLQMGVILKEALKLLRAAIPSSIEIHQDIDDNCYSVLADPVQLHQVVMNLCTNAYHAMREKGGVLAVSLRQVQISADDYPLNERLSPGLHVRLEVSDTGDGISPEIMERIFDPYFTTKAKGEGTGLGLSVVHGIVQSLNGHITVYSEQGTGTTFHVYLPCVTQAAADLEPTDESPAPTGNERLLVVDDEPEIARFYEQSLTKFGYTVTTVTTSTAALDLFRESPQYFDMVITDMTMPQMNGVELARTLLAVRSDLPIILCTGFSEILNEEKAKQLGIRRLVMKPVMAKDLARTVRCSLDETTPQ